MRSILILVPLLIGLTTFASAAQENSSISDQVASLKEQVESLKISVQELKTQNEDAKSSFKSVEQKLIEVKGLAPDTEFTKSMVQRAKAFEEQREFIKVWGSLTAITQTSINRRIHTSTQGNILYVDGAGNILANRFGQNSEDQTIGAGSFDLYLEAKVTGNTKVFTNLEANSPNQVFSPTLSLPNGNGTFSTHLNPQNLDVLNVLELYVESQWYDSRFTTTIGKIDLSNYFDGNTVAWDEHRQFLAGIFLDDPVFISVAPLNTIGARGSLNVGWGITFQAAVVSQDNSGQKLFNQMFAIGEIDYQTFFFFGKEGNYRAFGYVKDVDTIDQFGLATGRSTNGLGGGVSIDQKLTDKLTVFSRYGWNEDVLADGPSVAIPPFAAVESSISVGGQYKGLLPNRPDDMFGGAWGLINPSDPRTFNSGLPERPDNEYFMEFYYNYQIHDNFHVSPLLQLIIHPNGDDDENWTTILGGRAFLEF